MMVEKPLGKKMGDWFRQLLSCCAREEDEEERPALIISGPTNFRREEVKLPGLDPEQQQFIRTKAIADAQKMWTHLQPLRSSPSGQFASPAILPSYEEFTTPRSPPTTSPSNTRKESGESRLERVKRHSRKISNSFSKPLGYHSVSPGDGKYKMRALMDPSRTQVLGAAKSSGESFSVGGSDQEDRDSGKGMGRF